jgi:hypothetical protein
MVGSEVVTGTPSSGTSTADCAEPGSFLLGGGFEIVGVGANPPNPSDDVLASTPNEGGTGWEATLEAITAETEIVAYAVCSEPPTP